MNDEVKLILTKLKIVSEEKENGAYICDKEHSKLLLSYIEKLEKDKKEFKDGLQQEIYDKNKVLNDWFEDERKINVLENNRDKVIRTLESLKGSARWERHLYEVDYMLDMLRDDTDDKK